MFVYNDSCDIMPKRNLSVKTKLKLISNIENCDLNNFDASREYGVSTATIYRCLASADSIIEAVENGQGKKAR